ncbi:MAG: hypothetical protein Q9163_000485 [Psora crenata]
MGSQNDLTGAILEKDGSISPPPKRRRTSHSLKERSDSTIDVGESTGSSSGAKIGSLSAASKPKTIPSPMQLNFVSEFPVSSNVDTVSLGSILGDPMIKECWLFNYLFEVDFVMRQFDPDVKDLVKIHIIHGSWRKEDTNGIGIIEGAKRYPNIHVIKAYMPEAYGTHHAKMAVLSRRDDLAQVIITTGNFIEKDWRMSQAFWRSPLLPMQNQPDELLSPAPGLGSGQRFKRDLLAYIDNYGAKLAGLGAQLRQYDFSEVRGALVASTPGRQNIRSLDQGKETIWGLPGLQRILQGIPSNGASEGHDRMYNVGVRKPHIVTQISSVASVGEKWLTSTFFPTLSTAADQMSKPITAPPRSRATAPDYSIIFPTASEIRNSIDGYGSGSSIHMKTQTSAQAKQLQFIRPMLCHWAPSPIPNPPQPAGEAATGKTDRHPAAPHIKTYVRFSDPSMRKIDWAMMTSANLSTQAWGSAPNASGEVRICSYELGIVVWPGLWDEEGCEGGRTEMVPVFKHDTPTAQEVELPTEGVKERARAVEGRDAVVRDAGL